MAKRFNEEQSIEDVLKNFISHNKLQTGIDKVEVKEVWFKLMGNGVANYTEEVELKKGTLYVKLSSPVLREELMYGREKIITMINVELGKEVVKSLILR
jgi:transcription initiation factor IIE alpha subunit